MAGAHPPHTHTHPAARLAWKLHQRIELPKTPLLRASKDRPRLLASAPRWLVREAQCVLWAWLGAGLRDGDSSPSGDRQQQDRWPSLLQQPAGKEGSAPRCREVLSGAFCCGPLSLRPWASHITREQRLRPYKHTCAHTCITCAAGGHSPAGARTPARPPTAFFPCRP